MKKILVIDDDLEVCKQRAIMIQSILFITFYLIGKVFVLYNDTIVNLRTLTNACGMTDYTARAIAMEHTEGEPK